MQILQIQYLPLSPESFAIARHYVGLLSRSATFRSTKPDALHPDRSQRRSPCRGNAWGEYQHSDPKLDVRSRVERSFISHFASKVASSKNLQPA